VPVLRSVRLPVASFIEARARRAFATALTALVIAINALASCAAQADSPPDASDRIAAFLAAVEGKWEGKAAVTPIGPRPYDITFRRNATGDLEGSAQPGGATHVWTFRQEGRSLQLRFLSTFRGNRQPILLLLQDEVDGEWVFQAVQPVFLKVRIRIETREMVIRVLHHDRLHVEIRLRRLQGSANRWPAPPGSIG